MEIVAGPDYVKSITLQSFALVPAAGAEALLRTWAEYSAPLPEAHREQMETEPYPRLRSATSSSQLTDLRATTEHDWGNVVGLTGFYEFVLIDRGARTAALVVARDD